MRFSLQLLKVLFNLKFSILFFIYLCVVAFLPNDFVPSGNILLSLLVLLFLNHILSRGKWWIRILPNVIFVFFISLSAFFSFMYSSWVWTESLLSILRTNVGEASEMISTFLLPALLIILVSVGLTVLSQKEMRKLKFPSLVISSLVVCFYTFLFLPFMVNRIIERIEFRTARDSSVMNAQYTNMFAPVFYGNIVSSYAAMTELNKIKNLLKLSEDKKDVQGIELGDTSSPYKRIVVVMGESSNKNHYTLYGYDRATTPFLDSLKQLKNTNLDYFDAISPASSTVLSLFRSLSFATLGDASAAYTMKSSIDLANDAGYKTYWISAQDPVGESNSEIGLIALGTDEQNYLSNHKSRGGLDIDLIPYLKEVYGKEENQLIVLHLMGSHIYYSARIDDVDKKAIEDSDRNTNAYNSVDDYDRSIHHSDRVLREIYKTMKGDTTALMIYTSDHAEIVGLGHGYSKQYREQHEIPFLTFNFTSQYADSTILKYTNADTNRFNTVNLSYILAEYMGYTVNPSLVEQAKRDAQYVLLQSGEVIDYNSVK